LQYCNIGNERGGVVGVQQPQNILAHSLTDCSGASGVTSPAP
jgi:hypothetical protein